MSALLGWLAITFPAVAAASVNGIGLALNFLWLFALFGLPIAFGLTWLFAAPILFSQLGGGDRIREIDGILAPYGWQMLAQNTALFLGLGMAIALMVRFSIGPGRPRP